MVKAHVLVVDDDLALAEMLGIELQDAHRALADAVATQQVFSSLVDRLHAWDLDTLEELVRLARLTGWPMLTVLRSAGHL